MINMISRANLNKLDQKKSFVSENETPAKNDDFAALFSVPVEPSKNHIDQASKMGEETVASKTVESNQVLIEAGIQNGASEIKALQNSAQQNFTLEKQSLTTETAEGFTDSKELFAQTQNNFQIKDLSQRETANLSEQAEKLIKSGVESGRVEILNVSENLKAAGFSQINYAENAPSVGKEKNANLNILPSLFREMANVFKNEEPAKSKQGNAADFAIEHGSFDESPIAVQIKSNGTDNQSGFNFNQLDTELPKAEEQLKFTDDFSAISFEKVLAAPMKEQKLGESAPQPLIKTYEVLEQVETQTLQLLSLRTVENEKKVMKMRLHPAELGAVEIKLERDASGKLNAHFQTESEATKQILNESLEHLRTTLENSGWQVEQLEISCSPFSADQGERDNESQQFETVENQPNKKAVLDDSSVNQDDLKPNESNRLLSVRA